MFLGAHKNRLIEYPQHMIWLRNKKTLKAPITAADDKFSDIFTSYRKK